MSSTYVSGRAVVSLSKGSDPFVALFCETAESNVFPQTPHWSCWFYGRLSMALKKIIQGSYYFDGGCTKGARGRLIKPETDLKAWKEALRNPFKPCVTKVQLEVKRRYCSITSAALRDRAQAIKDVCESTGSTAGLTLHNYFTDSFFEFDLVNDADLAAIDLLVNRRLKEPTSFQEADNTLVSCWQILDRIYSAFSTHADPVELPKVVPSGKKGYSVMPIVTRPYVDQPGWVDKKCCVIVDGLVVSANALRWICNMKPSHLKASDEIEGAIQAIREFNKAIQETESFTAANAFLFAEPLSTVGLPRYRAEQYGKLGIGNASARLTAENIATALDLIDAGLVVRVGNDMATSDGSTMSANEEVQGELCF